MGGSSEQWEGVVGRGRSNEVWEEAVGIERE